MTLDPGSRLELAASPVGVDRRKRPCPRQQWRSSPRTVWRTCAEDEELTSQDLRAAGTSLQPLAPQTASGIHEFAYQVRNNRAMPEQRKRYLQPITLTGLASHIRCGHEERGDGTAQLTGHVERASFEQERSVWLALATMNFDPNREPRRRPDRQHAVEPRTRRRCDGGPQHDPVSLKQLDTPSAVARETNLRNKAWRCGCRVHRVRP
jgi:hypothetical protein